MALFRRSKRAAAPTVRDPGQVGAAATPAAHTASAPQGSYDPERDEIGQDPRSRDDGIIPAEVRRWRAPVSGTLAAPPSGPMSEDMGAVPGKHTGGGAPDPRRVYDPGPIGQAGYPLPKDEAYYPYAEDNIVRPAAPVVIAGQEPPVRVRAGSTGADPTRPAVMPIAMMMRPWDKWAAESFGVTGVTKIEEASPLAAVPIQDTRDVHDPAPSASGGLAARGMEPAGIQPNTFRLAPRAWDEMTIVTAQQSTPESTRRAGGWRARG